MRVIFGTGTRQIQILPTARKAEILTAAKLFLTAKVEEFGDVKVISGMAEGWDAAFATAAVQLDIPFIACVPNPGYGAYYWGKKSLTGTDRLAAFNALLGKAESVEYTNELLGTKDLYFQGLHMNFHRNHRMVALGDEGAAWDQTSRGTKECVAYARAQQVPVTFLG